MLETFADLSTPLVADACIRSGVPLRAAPPGIAAVVAAHRIAGRVLPARHCGSVDVFLEALGRAGRGSWSVQSPCRLAEINCAWAWVAARIWSGPVQALTCLDHVRVMLVSELHGFDARAHAGIVVWAAATASGRVTLDEWYPRRRRVFV